jgi:hypothetical protein
MTLCVSFPYPLKMKVMKMPSKWPESGLETERVTFPFFLGMYEDADECDEDELKVWGNILSDVAQHIANGFKRSHGWSEVETMAQLRKHFNRAIKERAPGLEGRFLDEH